MAKRIISIQHTQSIHHGTGMPGAWIDWGLSELGKQHAENIGRKLHDELKGQNWKIYSSDLARAIQTVERLAGYMDLEINIMPDLRENNYLSSECMTRMAAWCNENGHPIPSCLGRAQLDNETWEVFWERVAGCCDKIEADEADNIIIVSHGMTMSVWQHAWLDLGISDFVYTGHPGGVCHMQANENGRRIINRWNDTYYMK